MQRLLYVPVLFLLFSCSGGGKAPRFNGNLSSEFLKGTWMVSGSDLSALKDQPYELRDQMDTYLIQHVLQFDGREKVSSDNGDIIPRQGTYQANEKALKLDLGNETFYYSLDRGSDSSLILLIEKSKNPLFTEGKIILKRLNTEKYKIEDLSWKASPEQPLSGSEIKKKLKAMLTYYEQYFYAMMDRNIDILAHRKIMLPVKYFSNGIELRPFEERKGWDVYFGDSTHARTAYNILEKAYDKIAFFPTRKPPFQIYAIIFSNLAKNIDAAN